MNFKPTGLIFLKETLGEDGLEEIKKFELYKPNSNVVVDHEEIRTGLQIVPRAILSFLQTNLSSMKIGENKNIKIPVGVDAILRVTKKDSDVYIGDIIKEGKKACLIKNRSIPGIGLLIMTTFEMYYPEDLDSNINPINDETSSKMQRIIDRKIYANSLASDVVNNNISQKEAIDKMIKDRLTEMLSEKDEDASEKENLTLKSFLEKVNNKKSFNVKMNKNESVQCPDCNDTILKNGVWSGCLCFGDNRNNKIFLTKNEDGNVSIRFSKNWDIENIEMLLDILRSKNERV
jgi:hypothetical protein